MRRRWPWAAAGAMVGMMGAGVLWAQDAPGKPHVVPVPSLQSQAAVKEPSDPPAQTVMDAKGHLSFHLGPGWSLSRRDGEISTFALDARTAPRRSQMHSVAALGFNPFPSSTFEGALFYVSSSPATSAAACAAQTTLPPARPIPPTVVDDVHFSRSSEERGTICTESRDVVYAGLHQGACLRFDLVINNFCGGDVSGAQDLTKAQLGSLLERLEGIVGTVKLR